MCPPGPSPSSDIRAYWTDEELISFLDRAQHGSPLPGNVLADVNPFEHEPPNLPIDVWFFVHSENKEETEIGSWKAKGEGCQIYSNSKLIGWRTTLEFYEGQYQNGLKTDWVMQKYWITRKGSSNLKASGCLYRIFPCDGECAKQKRQRCLISGSFGGEEEQGYSCNSRNDSAEIAQVNVRHNETKSTHPGGNEDDIDCFSTGDYLELLDLVNPRSSSSSSDNSSWVSLASDEVFDYLALLDDLDPESIKENKSKSTSSNLSVSLCSASKKVLVPPAMSGSMASGEANWSPGDTLNAEHHPPPNIRLQGKVENENDGQTNMAENNALPNSQEASTSRRPMPPDKGKKIAVGKMKMLKYFCFMSF